MVRNTSNGLEAASFPMLIKHAIPTATAPLNQNACFESFNACADLKKNRAWLWVRFSPYQWAIRLC
ncbi:hypothetical protein BCR34DRAFT_554615 [Clohesyomyces aquaticus]|uniref:Uncharacterized protein n=1 Tax=Clohesyomyces aquaticus TaxID=1231657 RepID=A0A1Y2A7H9_9PLEO|nr:hypothetical protein BCR34DRAFT_554615 [Clohesyomyces aquaticus]